MKTVTFKKMDPAKQIAFAEVYVPMVRDTQGDFMTAEDIEAIAYSFIGNGKVRDIDTDHDGRPNGSFAVESYVAKLDDRTFAPGAWVLGVKVPNKALWQAIENGTYTGFSMEGTGHRQPTTLNGQPANLLKDVTVNSVSIVKRGANMEKFKVKKSDPIAALVEQFENIAARIEKTTERIDGLQKRVDDFSVSTGNGTVRKAEPHPNQERAEFLLRKKERLQSKLERIWENPHDGFESESEILAKIAKCDDTLYSLGYRPKLAGLDDAGRSAFIHRGGSSNFLQASSSTVDEILGVGARRGNDISKSTGILTEDDIPVENCLIL